MHMFRHRFGASFFFDAIGGLVMPVAAVLVGWPVVQSLKYASLRAKDPEAAEALRQNLIKRWHKTDKPPAWYLVLIALIVGY